MKKTYWDLELILSYLQLNGNRDQATIKLLFRTCLILLVTITFISTSTSAQNIGINSTGATPNTSAILDVSATEKGMLIPRVSLISTNDITTITNPSISLLAYPNPSQGNFNVNIRNENLENLYLTIQDMKGNIVYNNQLLNQIQ